MKTILQSKSDIYFKIMSCSCYLYPEDCVKKWGKSYLKSIGNQHNPDFKWDINLLKNENVEQLKKILEDRKRPSEIIEYEI